MGNFIFIVLHIIAVLFGFWMLIITIPAHLIYVAVSGRSEPAATSETHVKCPDCAELVLKEARVCKHCVCKLVPTVTAPPKTAGDWYDQVAENAKAEWREFRGKPPEPK